MRIPYISLLAAGALALSGCAYGDLGLGMGYGGYGGYYGASYGGYPGYGYGGYPYGPYGGYGTYPGYYGGFGAPNFGWYDNYYYPGSGYYVYDSARRPYAMSTRQREYWSRRSPALRTSGTTSTKMRENWSGFDRRSRGRDGSREQSSSERQ